MENPKILVVDDTEENVEILNELLGEEYDVLSALDGEFAIEIAHEDGPNLILLDIMMPDPDGFEVCRRLKEDPETENIPIIFITAKTDENSIEKAYDIGGIDYITKPFKPKELMAKVKRELKLQELYRQLELSATTDPLTKLYNRRYFTDTSRQLLNLARREKQRMSLIMLDIDKFKSVNDTYGHKAGDEVIVSLADTILLGKRKSDFACRYGGEEFVVVLPDTTIEGAKGLAEKIRENVEKKAVETEGRSIAFTVSIGVSEIDVGKEANIEAGLKRADEALYEAKKGGRNKVAVRNI